MHYNKFCIKTLGCKVNSYESEFIYSLFVKKGYVFDSENADIYVINTCTVTNMSDRKSRQIINSIRRDHKDSIIIGIGCYAQNAYQTDRLDEIDADIILGNKDKSKIIEYLEDYINNKSKIQRFYNLENETFEDMFIDGEESRTRAYVKIQDGCENFCSYCIIPYVRGGLRSKSRDKVIEEVTSLVNKGHKEIVLTGIHTGSYNDNGYDFANLLEDLVSIPNLERLRISSIEINELNDRVLKVFSESKTLVPHLHIPLQSGSDEVLKLMNRKYDKKFYLDKINYMRSIKENLSITTDVIVGFPGETESMFLECLDFIKEVKFTSIHVFPYSDRYGTVASMMNEKVDGVEKKRRVKELMNLSLELEKEFYTNYYGKTMRVLFEEKKDGYFIGHTDNFIKVKVTGDYKVHEIYDIIINEENIIK